MKNIIVITRTYYPDMSPISVVIDKYIQRLKGEYMFHIISWAPRLDYKPLEDPHINVYYIEDFWYHLRAACEKNIKNNSRMKFIYKFILTLLKIRTAIGNLFVDYFANQWMERKAYAGIKKIASNVKIDTIISVSGADVYSHLAAMKYKKKDKDIKWITFFTDPFTYSSSDYTNTIYNSKKRTTHRYNIELNIYEAANYNILFEDIYYDAITKFKQPMKKTFQFKFVLDDTRLDVKKYNTLNNNQIRLLYAGSLYKKIRNPQFMLSVVSKLENIQLDIYTRTQDCIDIIKKYESYKIHNYYAVDTQRYKEMICNEYDILINIGNNCINQLPSKMLEMLSTGRPILNFYYYKDSQYEMIEKYPLGINIKIEDNYKSAVEDVQHFCNEMKGKQLTFDEVQQLYPENNIQRQLYIMKQLIN